MWVFRYPEVAAAVAAKVSKVRSYLKQCIARILLDKFFNTFQLLFRLASAHNSWQQLTTAENSWKVTKNLSTKTPFLVWTDSNRGHGQVVSIFCLPFFSSLNKKIIIFNNSTEFRKKIFKKRPKCHNVCWKTKKKIKKVCARDQRAV